MRHAMISIFNVVIFMFIQNTRMSTYGLKNKFIYPRKYIITENNVSQVTTFLLNAKFSQVPPKIPKSLPKTTHGLLCNFFSCRPGFMSNRWLELFVTCPLRTSRNPQKEVTDGADRENQRDGHEHFQNKPDRWSCCVSCCTVQLKLHLFHANSRSLKFQTEKWVQQFDVSSRIYLK